METKTNIHLESGKKYMPYISIDFPNSAPIVQMLKDYNPIFICAGKQTDSFGNYIHFQEDPHKLYYEDIAKEVMTNSNVQTLFHRLKKSQGTIPIKMWRNHPSFNELFLDHSLVPKGFSPEEAHKLNSKFFQYQKLNGKVPIAKHKIVKTVDAIHLYDQLSNRAGIFTSLEYGGGGSGARLHETKQSFENYLSSITDESLIIAEALEVLSSPSIDILVANENEIFVYGLVDQWLNGLSCIGGKYPSSLHPKLKQDCFEIAKVVGKSMAEEGVRGYFSLDIVVDQNNNPYFCEINGRYSGTTGPRIWAMEQSKPLGYPSILDLEMMALENNSFNGFNLWPEPSLAWYKREIRTIVKGNINDIVVEEDISQVFKSGGIALLGRLPKNTPVGDHPKKVLGNLVGVAKDLDNLNYLANKSEEFINRYISFTN